MNKNNWNQIGIIDGKTKDTNFVDSKVFFLNILHLKSSKPYLVSLKKLHFKSYSAFKKLKKKDDFIYLQLYSTQGFHLTIFKIKFK